MNDAIIHYGAQMTEKMKAIRILSMMDGLLLN